jgi:EAL domain-containing protein (putative c-di-GMP-specific phosphodiesterase class I)
MLRNLGYGEAQGNYVSKPVAAADIPGLVPSP